VDVVNRSWNDEPSRDERVAEGIGTFVATLQAVLTIIGATWLAVWLFLNGWIVTGVLVSAAGFSGLVTAAVGTITHVFKY
jgi:uncharacterized membrane protein